MQTPHLPNGNHHQFPFDKSPNGNETSVIAISPENVSPNAYYPYGKQKEEENAINLRELWRRIKRRKWLVVLIVSVTTLMMAVETARQKNVYQATATVEIGKNAQMILKTGDLTIENDNSQIETALFLLSSYPLLEETAINLNLDKNLAFLDITKQRSFWDVVKQKLDKDDSDGERKAEEDRLDVEQIEATNLQKLSREESKRLAPYVNILRDGLTVKQLRTSKLVKLSFNHTNPEIAAMVTNGIAQTFKERSFYRKTEKYSNTSSWLNRSTRDLESQMQKAEQAIADYTRANGIFSTEGKEDLTTTKLSHLYDQTMRAETDRLIKQSLYEEVRQGRVAQLPEAFSNTATSDLQKKLSDLTVAAAQLNAKYGADNPRVVEVKDQVVALREEISKTRTQLAEKLKADYERAQRDEASLKAALGRAKGEAVQQNQTAIQFNILKQNVETAKSLYTDFLQKTRQADIEMAQQSRDVIIAEPARTPEGPIGPQRFRSVLLSFLLSLAAGVGLCFLLDHLDNTIKTVDDVTRYVHLPSLGIIPSLNSAAARRGVYGQRKKSLNGKPETAAMQATSALAKGDSSTPVAEAYRMLRTSILLAAAGQPPKTILMTSSQPGEGKTTTSVNTGICLSQMGAKVLIIDADMRRPRVHKMFGLNHRRGLSNYLSSDMLLKNVVQPTRIPNLWVLPSGIVPPNSADLLSSEKMHSMLQKLSGYFDHILIDSPPITSVTDPILLSRMVDGVVMVIHGGKSSREMVAYARQELHNVGAKILGVVLNNVNLARDGYDYYYYRRYQYEYKRDAGDTGNLN
ncbi:MAG: polysaccharide biosynthesis tyrosine autokinase [Acidobacteriota bacterium]